jgi:hypothetical protein
MFGAFSHRDLERALRPWLRYRIHHQYSWLNLLEEAHRDFMGARAWASSYLLESSLQKEISKHRGEQL